MTSSDDEKSECIRETLVSLIDIERCLDCINRELKKDIIYSSYIFEKCNRINYMTTVMIKNVEIMRQLGEIK